jgi:hypothetical protein
MGKTSVHNLILGRCAASGPEIFGAFATYVELKGQQGLNLDELEGRGSRANCACVPGIGFHGLKIGGMAIGEL